MIEVALLAAVAVRALAAAQQRAAFVETRARRSARCFRDAAAVISGPICVFSRAGSPTRSLRCAFGQPRHELVVDRALHEQARARDARFARRTEDAVQHAVHRMVEVGVVAARWSATCRRVRARPASACRPRCARCRGPTVGAAGERHLLDERMPHERVADHRALARQHADDALRHAGFLADARELERHQRRDFGRLHHHRVAGGERRRELLRVAWRSANSTA